MGFPVSGDGGLAWRLSCRWRFSYRAGQERWARDPHPTGRLSQIWELALLPGLKEEDGSHCRLPGSCHGIEPGLGSRTGHAGNELCFLGRQPVLVPTGFRALRKVAAQAPTATLGQPTPGPGWAGTPCLWSLGQSIAAGETTTLSPFPGPLLPAERCCMEERRGMTGSLGAVTRCVREHTGFTFGCFIMSSSHPLRG